MRQRPTQPPGRETSKRQFWIAIGLGVISVGGTVLLAAADAIHGGVNWTDHAPA
jgi:hypothetical protein